MNTLSTAELPPGVVLSSPTALVLRLAKPLAGVRRRGLALAVAALVLALVVLLLARLAGPHTTFLGAVVLFVGFFGLAAYEILVEVTLVANATTNTLAVEYRVPPSHRKMRRRLCDARAITSFEVMGHVDTETDVRPYAVFVVSAKVRRKRLPLWTTDNLESANAVAAALGQLFDRPWHAG